MKMFKILSSLAVLFAVAAAPLAASQARTYGDALKRSGGKRPIIVFCYAANYNKHGLKVYDELVKNRRSPVAKILNREIFVVVPIFQQPDEREKKEYDKVMGGHRLPGGIWSYPSFTVIDGKGNFRGVVQSSDELSDPEKTAEALTSILEGFREQESILGKAERASGSNKTKLMREALNISDVRVPGHGMCDPSTNGIVQDLQIKGIAEANNYVRNIINNGNYTKLERQMILSAYAGHVRRSKGPIPLLRAIYTEMRNIDPKSSYGAYAEGAIEIWVVPHEVDTKAKTKAASESSEEPADKEKEEQDK